MENNCNVVRIHLKTATEKRKALIDFCLYGKPQYVAVGWSCVHESAPDIETFDDFYKAVLKWNKKYNHRINAAINRFYETKENDLFWTREENTYWICRATGTAMPLEDGDLDIGAVVPVEAYRCKIDVPGQIQASFSRRRGGISERFSDDNLIVAFSQHAFNESSGREVYKVSKIQTDDFLDNLPPFDLEELVISYIQITGNYYVLSNSIAKNSTTPLIECRFLSRDKENPKSAVVQVKGGKAQIDASKYREYDKDGCTIYFYSSEPVVNGEEIKNKVEITKNQLLEFYREYKDVLPTSITRWESIFG